MIVLAHSSFAQSAGEVWNFFAQGLRDAIWVRKEEELARLYHISIPSQTDLPISYNIAPSLDHSLQCANAIAFARRHPVGINPLLGEGP